MSDEAIVETAEPEGAVADQPKQSPKPTPPEGVDDLPKWARDSLTKANREAAEYRARVREFEQREQEAAEAEMTELERMQAQLAEAKQAADLERAAAARYKAASEHGVPADYIDLLGSVPADEMSDKAARLGGLVKAAAEADVLREEVEALRKGSPLRSRPVEQLRPGATPSDNEDEGIALYNQLFGGNRNG